jgi:catechol 2,3-dioxygenase-like lactoylglutathione lyase family enzyme
MAKLRHFAIVVKDQERSARFYEQAFGLKRVGYEDLGWSSAQYMTDGVINLALLHYREERGSGLKDPKNYVGAHHFGFQVEDLVEAQKQIEAAGGTFFLTSATTPRKRISSASSRTRTGSSSTSRRRAGAAPTAADNEGVGRFSGDIAGIRVAAGTHQSAQSCQPGRPLEVCSATASMRAQRI